MNKKIKVYFSKAKKPLFNRITIASKDYFNTRIKNKDIDTTKGGIFHYFDNKVNSTIFCAINPKTDVDNLQETGANAIKKAQEIYPENNIEITLIMDNSIKTKDRYFIEKGVLMKTKKDNYFKSEQKNGEIIIKNIKNKDLVYIVDSINHARELTFKPANIITPQTVADYIQKHIAIDKNISTKILEESDLKKENMNLFLAVGQGSTQKPKMIIMDYSPKGLSKKQKDSPIMLVGKGLTYDSGGLYAKPYPYMNEMFGDMAGSATVVGIMSNLSKLGIQKRIIGIVGLAENMPDGNSYKNGDIIKSKSGKTVYVGHTDAEGRLVLADILTYAKENYNASLTIDFATLTGACMLALGEKYTGTFSDNIELTKKLEKSGLETNDLTRNLPLDKECKKAVEHNLADLSNTSKFRGILGASTAAAFLSNFVQDTKKRVHCDIAGSALRSEMRKSYDLDNGLGTGSMVHNILNILKK